MIKLIVSDFDGCLFDSKEIHFQALNMALATLDEKFVISEEEHLQTFDGLSTKTKLNILSKTKNFPIDKMEEVNSLKQKFTIELYQDIIPNQKIIDAIIKFKSEGYLFYVASNAIMQTLEIALNKLGIRNLIDKVYSNENVANQKPHPEMYLKCMVDAKVDPKETLIIEDSKHGRESASRSGGYVYGMDNSSKFDYQSISDFIKKINPSKIKWAGKSDLNILIPMAGAGTRFKQEGYQLPKPLIPVNGKPMIQLVVENLNIDANYIFICQQSHYQEYNLGTFLNLIVPGCTVIQQTEKLSGATSTSLLAKELINNDNHLLIVNSDQFVEWNSSDFMYYMISNNADGGILTFKAHEKKWSFARVDEHNKVLEVAEKNPISDNATVGVYYYKSGSDYVKYAEQMISKNIRVNNEFYICPVFNEFIADNKTIKIKQCDKMWGLGTPEDLEFYLKNHKG